MITEKAYMEHLYTEGTEGYIELTHDFKRYKMINYYSLNEIERFYGMVYNLVCSCEMVVAAFFDVYSAVVTAVIHK